MRTPVTVTEQAQERIQALLKARSKPALGIRIGIKNRGCSGLAYTFEYEEEQKKGDEVVQFPEFALFISSESLLYLLGIEIDYVEEDIHTGFVFRNPNEKSRCGCGESFHV